MKVGNSLILLLRLCGERIYQVQISYRQLLTSNDDRVHMTGSFSVL
jgi:hypothetical protein